MDVGTRAEGQALLRLQGCRGRARTDPILRRSQHQMAPTRAITMPETTSSFVVPVGYMVGLLFTWPYEASTLQSSPIIPSSRSDPWLSRSLRTCGARLSIKGDTSKKTAKPKCRTIARYDNLQGGGQQPSSSSGVGGPSSLHCAFSRLDASPLTHQGTESVPSSVPEKRTGRFRRSWWRRKLPGRVLRSTWSRISTLRTLSVTVMGKSLTNLT